RPAGLEVFETGYRNINDKSLKKVSLAATALEGMRGIASIDPELTVKRQGDTVSLMNSDTTVASFQAPPEDDVKGWSALTMDLSSAGRGVSVELREADAEKLYQAVFDSALSNLDVFSHYAGAEEAKKNRAKRDGFSGIGIRFRMVGEDALITQVLPRTPAFSAGLKRNDVITHVDKASTAGWSKEEVTARLRGPVNSMVEVTVRRRKKKEPLGFEIERQLIVPTTVTYGYDKGVVFLKITNFNTRTSRDLTAKLKKARRDHGGEMKGVVLDLRGNPGGLLKQSIKVAGLFLTQGHIISTRGRHPDSLQSYDAGGSDQAGGLPLAVLIDGKSASAAEVVAAALQDRGRAVVIGTSSFGKGTVQTVVRLPNEGEITLTWSRLIPPSGYVLHGLGVFPAICTSGAGVGGRQIIEAVLADRGKAVSIMEEWRKTSMENETKRRDLRASCPAQKRANPLEIELARGLINDRDLFLRVLNLFPAPEAAQH
ncbi:MAG: S41 family peptidase, partial [Rhodospirillales bacterium]